MKNRKQLILTSSILFIILWCNGQVIDSSFSEQDTVTINNRYKKRGVSIDKDSLINIFDANSKIMHYDLSKYSRYTPTLEEYFSVRDVIKKYIENNSKDKTLNNEAITNYDNYYKQIYGLVDNKGNRILFVNCFVNPLGKLHFYWRDETVRVKGGGRDYLNLKINLSNKKVYDFDVNSFK